MPFTLPNSAFTSIEASRWLQSWYTGIHETHLPGKRLRGAPQSEEDTVQNYENINCTVLVQMVGV